MASFHMLPSLLHNCHRRPHFPPLSSAAADDNLKSILNESRLLELHPQVRL